MKWNFVIDISGHLLRIKGEGWGPSKVQQLHASGGLISADFENANKNFFDFVLNF